VCVFVAGCRQSCYAHAARATMRACMHSGWPAGTLQCGTRRGALLPRTLHLAVCGVAHHACVVLPLAHKLPDQVLGAISLAPHLSRVRVGNQA
jgi:hypothetical protein